MQATASELSRLEGATTLTYDESRGIVLRIFSGALAGREYVIDPATLRRDSRDALSVDEITGQKVRAHGRICPLRCSAHRSDTPEHALLLLHVSGWIPQRSPTISSP